MLEIFIGDDKDDTTTKTVEFPFNYPAIEKSEEQWIIGKAIHLCNGEPMKGGLQHYAECDRLVSADWRLSRELTKRGNDRRSELNQNRLLYESRSKVLTRV